MKPRYLSCCLGIASIVHFLLLPSASADEGWWLFSDPPRKQLKERYQFELTDAWLDHVRLASVRFSGGGSGSFVSPEGLILSNHHVVSDVLQNMRTSARDYIRDGFLATRTDQEVRCPNLSVQVLLASEDVTPRVLAAIKPGMTPIETAKARRAAFYALEKEACGPTGLVGEVVELGHGHRYYLYRYKEYTDIRLVFAPDMWVGSQFDLCALRAYEAGKPAVVQHFLKCCSHEPKEGELIFVSGCPVTTRRHLTVADMKFLRQQQWRYFEWYCRHMRLLEDFRDLGGENMNQTEVDYHRDEVGKDLSDQELSLLRPDSQLVRRRQGKESAIRDAIAKARLQKEYGGCWDRLADLLNRKEQVQRVDDLLHECLWSRLFIYAIRLVRLPKESAKPDPERLNGYNDANLPALKRWLYTDVPTNEALEIRELRDSLAYFEKEMGPNNDLVGKVLAGKKPSERAVELVRGSRLGTVGVRRALADGGSLAIAQSKDPMVELARLVDAPERDLRIQLDDDLGEQIRQEHIRIAAGIETVKGPEAYPDATGTLRLSFGRIPKPQNQDCAAYWPINLLFWSLRDRPSVAPPQIHSALEPRSIRVQRGLRFDTPFVFESDADSSFGNSGSPILNRRCEQTAVVRSGPTQAMFLTYEYDPDRCRFVAISMSGAFEILLNVYGALELVNELTGPPDQGRSVVRGR